MNDRDHNDSQRTPLNVCLVTAPWETDCGGYTFRTKLISILQSISDNLTVITGNFPDPTGPLPHTHIRNVVTPTRTGWFFLRALKNLQIQFTLAYHMIASASTYDLVLIMSGGGLVIPSITARLLRKKTAYIISGVSGSEVYRMARLFYSSSLFGLGRLILPGILSWMERCNVKLADWAIFEVRPAILNNQDIDPDRKTAWGPLNVEEAYLRPIKRFSDRETIIGFIGRLSREKGILELSRAIPLILSKRNDVKFQICGIGELTDDAKSIIAKAGFEEYVTFTGFIPHDDVPDILAGMKLLVLPSYMEGLPNVVIEAMACGVPVLATRVGAIPDVVNEAETGFLLEDNTPEKIAESVLRIMDDPALETVASNAREYAEKEFSFNKAKERYATILEMMGR